MALAKAPLKGRELSGGHSVPPDKIRGRYTKALDNISKLLALSDVFRLVDNTAQPEILFVKDEVGQQIRPNGYWTVETIEKLITVLSSGAEDLRGWGGRYLRGQAGL